MSALWMCASGSGTLRPHTAAHTILYYPLNDSPPFAVIMISAQS